MTSINLENLNKLDRGKLLDAALESLKTEFSTELVAVENAGLKELFTQIMKSILTEQIALRGETDPVKLEKHSRNIKHYENALLSLKGVVEIKSYSAFCKAVGRTISLIVQGAIAAGIIVL